MLYINKYVFFLIILRLFHQQIKLKLASYILYHTQINICTIKYVLIFKGAHCHKTCIVTVTMCNVLLHYRYNIRVNITYTSVSGIYMLVRKIVWWFVSKLLPKNQLKFPTYHYTTHIQHIFIHSVWNIIYNIIIYNIIMTYWVIPDKYVIYVNECKMTIWTYTYFRGYIWRLVSRACKSATTTK